MSLTARAVADAWNGTLLLHCAVTGPMVRPPRCRTCCRPSRKTCCSIAQPIAFHREGIDSTVDGATNCVSEASNISISHSCNLETRVCQCRVTSTRIGASLEPRVDAVRSTALTRRVEMTMKEEQQRRCKMTKTE
ncbi:uncharacterized protein SCHCODRAFT_02147835 [Schizophyllum commune H4-8]|uniref:uncharacterized protein n=1 Tax=Schizophyllum commune (strain H4-8 / FGSC 9210) TaxID=578458 RepID=UPI00215F684B|nr:uncharacterized protein SCHCODRAFT_02147835 [Schizophyllum commune H4-8]KAI5897739.1 hypothetical protein SCHCODRAFT_02147835 [Schizophyllum commune H4-8]